MRRSFIEKIILVNENGINQCDWTKVSEDLKRDLSQKEGLITKELYIQVVWNRKDNIKRNKAQNEYWGWQMMLRTAVRSFLHRFQLKGKKNHKSTAVEICQKYGKHKKPPRLKFD